MMESPATAVVSGVMLSAGGSNHGYPDSVDSSPRSRGGDSWDEFPAAPALAAACAASRLRLMCSYGGRIMPRPTDKSLCYLGGETRIVVVDRQSSLGELTAKLSRKLLSGRAFTLKYQLPNEDLDSLISVTTEEDLENMIEEYDRLLACSGSGSGSGGSSGGASAGIGGSRRSGRLRLFLFPAKPESAPASAIGSLLDESKSETWFEDALNSAMGMGMDGLSRGLSADSASVNCLLGLEDDSSVHSHGVAAAITGVRAEPEQLVIPRPDSSGKLPRQVQDVQSVPDSPMLDTTSSFGSTSSAPSLSNLPPIRVGLDERPLDHRLDDHFAQMNLSSAAAADSSVVQRLDEGSKEPIYPPQHQAPPIPPVSAPSSAPASSPSENPHRAFSSDDEKPDHCGVRKQNPEKSCQIDTNIPDSSSRPIHVNAISDPKRDMSVLNPAYQVPNIMVADSSGYQLQQEQLQQHQQQLYSHLHHHQQQQQQQQQPQHQYIPANPHYIHHPATGAVVPVSSYYPIAAHSIQQSQQAQPYDQQIPVYYVPVRQTPYNLATVQPNLGNPGPIQTSVNPGMPVPRVPPKSELQTSLYGTGALAPSPGTLQPSLIHVAADQTHPYAGMGYHLVQHHHLSQSPAAIGNYGYEYVADSSHPQIYYSQATAAPGLGSQYQTVSSSSPMAAEGIAPGDAKATRAS